MQVGKTKDQVLYNKPSAAVHLGALAAGTLAQYNALNSSKLNLNNSIALGGSYIAFEGQHKTQHRVVFI